MTRKEVLQACIDASYKSIPLGEFELNRRALLMAIATCESSFGVDTFPRLEPAYDIGGYYYKRSPQLRQLYGQYGDAVSRSWGPFQIMYLSAIELGFDTKRHPSDLGEFTTNTAVACKYVARRCLRHTASVKDIFDAYNSGNSQDSNIPEEYVKKGMRYYDEYSKTHPEKS